MTDEREPLPEAEGATMVAVGDEGGKVLLKFPKPVTWIALDPQIAPLVAEKMIQAAGKCGVLVKIGVPKMKISDEQRLKMQQQAVLVIKNLRARGRSDAHIACELVDITLRDLL
jgi:hypothetical protein